MMLAVRSQYVPLLRVQLGNSRVELSPFRVKKFATVVLASHAEIAGLSVCESSGGRGINSKLTILRPGDGCHNRQGGLRSEVFA